MVAGALGEQGPPPYLGLVELWVHDDIGGSELLSLVASSTRFGDRVGGGVGDGVRRRAQGLMKVRSRAQRDVGIILAVQCANKDHRHDHQRSQRGQLTRQPAETARIVVRGGLLQRVGRDRWLIL